MRARSCAILWFVLLALTALALLLFAIIHWTNYWSLFVLLPCILAFVVPDLCQNYTPFEEVDMTQVRWDPPTFQSCRELGWVMAIVLMLVAYSIPVLSWYNAGFSCVGAALVQVSVTLLVWAYLLWLRVFGPFKNE